MTDRARLRVLAVVPYPLGTAPGQRYRIEQWAPYLREDGIELHFTPFAGAVLAKTIYEQGRHLAKVALMTQAWLAAHRSRVASRSL